MSRLFLATSFSGHVDYETGVISPDYRHNIESILASLRETGGFTVFCAVEDEGWTISADTPPEVGVSSSKKHPTTLMPTRCDLRTSLLIKLRHYCLRLMK